MKDIYLQIKNNNYIIVNTIIAGVILLIVVYSGIFSASGIEHPIKTLTTEPTVSTGLSRAFSEIVRFNFSKAEQYNSYSLHIFNFLFIQFLIRIIVSLILLRCKISKKVLLYTDILSSILLFLWAFSGFILNQF